MLTSDGFPTQLATSELASISRLYGWLGDRGLLLDSSLSRFQRPEGQITLTQQLYNIQILPGRVLQDRLPSYTVNIAILYFTGYAKPASPLEPYGTAHVVFIPAIIRHRKW